MAPQQNAEEFFNSIPRITKYIVGTSFALTLLTTLRVFSPYSLVLIPSKIFGSQLQLWRLFTNLLYFGPFSINFVFNFLFFLNFLQNLEKDHYDRRSGDFVFLIAFGVVFLTIGGLFFGLPILSFSLMSYIVYIWCNLNPQRDVGLFMIPIQVKAYWFPWALLALHTLMGASPVDDLIGIFVGHMFYFLDVKYPETYGKKFLKTPDFLNSLFPPTGMNIQGFTTATAQPTRRDNIFGGQGRRLVD